MLKVNLQLCNLTLKQLEYFRNLQCQQVARCGATLHCDSCDVNLRGEIWTGCVCAPPLLNGDAANHLILPLRYCTVYALICSLLCV